MKIRQQKDENYYEKIVTWKGEGDYKGAFFVLFVSLLVVNFLVTFAFFSNNLGHNSNWAFLINLIMVLISPLWILFGKKREVKFRRITN